MVKFVNLENGQVFDGSNPYIFWFDGEQSINMIYCKSICIVSDNELLDIKIEDNNIIKLLDLSNIEIPDDEISGFHYNTLSSLISENNSLKSKGTQYDENYFIHIIYFIAQSESLGEYICEFTINDNIFNIGADFYGENESLSVNLSNFGIDIPDSIQKAIYESNIHEDKKDNILVNRKFKELLSNYIDIMGNKGSYKSLLNSLKWFEYENININEIWKQKFEDKYIYQKKDLSSILKEKYRNQLNTLSKTTYISISTAMKNIISVNENCTYDSYKNPIIEYSSYKWSYEDMMLKMSILGEFYKTYFMPIHLDLIHSTIDDIVFSSPIKLKIINKLDRNDFIYNYNDIKCNINNHVFNLDNVSVQVGKDTIFGTQYEGQSNYDDINIIGVVKYVDKINNDNESKTFYSQLFTGVGVIIPITLDIDIYNDFIKNSQISYLKDNKWVYQKNYNKILPVNNKIILDFNLLCTEDKHYEVFVQFETGSNKLLTKKISFDVIDNNITLKLYKIRKKTKLVEDDLSSLPINDFIYGIQPYKETSKFYTYYINSESGKYSIGINHLMILKYDGKFDNDNYLKTNYFIINKYVDDELKYIVCISKYFQDDFNGKKILFKNAISLYKEFIYKNIYHYIPQFHYLENFDGNTLDDYSIKYETLCVIPDIKFGKLINTYEWEFENISNNTIIKLKNSIKEPMITNNINKSLDAGFYNIIFRYSLADGKIKEIKLNSAFYKK